LLSALLLPELPPTAYNVRICPLRVVVSSGVPRRVELPSMTISPPLPIDIDTPCTVDSRPGSIVCPSTEAPSESKGSYASLGSDESCLLLVPEAIDPSLEPDKSTSLGDFDEPCPMPGPVKSSLVPELDAVCPLPESEGLSPLVEPKSLHVFCPLDGSEALPALPVSDELSQSPHQTKLLHCLTHQSFRHGSDQTSLVNCCHQKGLHCCSSPPVGKKRDYSPSVSCLHCLLEHLIIWPR
jgi:hypothetical protein